MTTRVVNLRYERFNIYIGRPNSRYPDAKWGNPFVVNIHRTQDEVVKMHREWIMKQPELLAQIPIELKDKVLGCYCKPKPCHGDTLAELADSSG